MEERLRKILGSIGGLATPIDRIASTDDLFAAGLTSLATISVLIAIEEEFVVEIPDSLLRRETFRTVATLMDVIERLKVSDLA